MTVSVIDWLHNFFFFIVYLKWTIQGSKPWQNKLRSTFHKLSWAGTNCINLNKTVSKQPLKHVNNMIIFLFDPTRLDPGSAVRLPVRPVLNLVCRSLAVSCKSIVGWEMCKHVWQRDCSNLAHWPASFYYLLAIPFECLFIGGAQLLCCCVNTMLYHRLQPVEHRVPSFAFECMENTINNDNDKNRAV